MATGDDRVIDRLVDVTWAFNDWIAAKTWRLVVWYSISTCAVAAAVVWAVTS